MIGHTFEIQVAIVGYVSVGKSTVLNALLGDKFSEVSMKRTTAGVNFFRITQTNGSQESTSQMDIGEEETVRADSLAWLEQDRQKKSAENTHDEISKDNRTLRSCTSVQEKTFDIEVDDPICEMRQDTQLVLVDIPGINEADSNKKYKKYVESKWNTFDCVIVVMDAIQGVNTQEQVELLKFIQSNNLKKKKIPTIILGNKMDDPDDEEKLVLVQETRDEVISIFGTTCSESSLIDLIDSATNKKRKRISGTKNDEAVFIPISAMNAFIYRKASHLTLDSFQKFDKDVVDRIGRDEVGRKWKKLSDEEKFEVVRGAIGNDAEYKERLEGTNFENFLVALDYCIGGNDVQSSLISKQIDVSLSFLGSNEHESLSSTLHNVFKKCNAVGRSPKDLPLHFWRAYKKIEGDAFVKVEEDLDPSWFELPFTHLEEYYQLAGLLEWYSEQKKARLQMKSLLHLQLSLVNEMMEGWSFAGFVKRSCIKVEKDPKGCSQCEYYLGQNQSYTSCPSCGRPYRAVWTKPNSPSTDSRWHSLSPHDWMSLIASILLPSTEMEFYQSFGEEKTKLEQALTLLRVRFNSNEEFSSLPGFKGMLPPRGDVYLAAIRSNKSKGALLKVKMPELLSDPLHWGHLSWKYVKFCRSNEEESLCG